jgi:DNA modification methylase
MILVGDCLDVLRTLADNSVDSVVTDPPYGLSFMGKRWDYDVPSVEVWAECLRVLKPGGHLLAFAGTRTQHRMAVRIEDAGFEIRDLIAWVYGSGFPKSHNGEWGGTALKPALEPITVARKALAGTIEANWREHGTGALNIDGCRVPVEDAAYARNCSGDRGHDGSRSRDELGSTNISAGGGRAASGRWPANLLHDGSDEVLAGFPHTTSGKASATGHKRASSLHDTDAGWGMRHDTDAGQLYGDTGSAARFFKECNEWPESRSNAGIAPPSLSLQSAVAATVQSVAATWPSLAGIVSGDCLARSTSATPSECAAISAACTAAMTVIASGCSPESQHEKPTPCGSLAKAAATRTPTGTTTITASLWKSGGCVGSVTFTITPAPLDRGEAASRISYCAKASRSDRNDGTDNDHPTVKPTDLMRYLCRLVTPPGGLVLDPFAGSGSTGRGALLEGFRFLGIEREPDYAALAEARIAAVRARMNPPKAESPQADLFAEALA